MVQLRGECLKSIDLRRKPGVGVSALGGALRAHTLARNKSTLLRCSLGGIYLDEADRFLARLCHARVVLDIDDSLTRHFLDPVQVIALRRLEDGALLVAARR